MPHDAPRAGPPAEKEPARHVQQPGKATEPRSASTVAQPVDRASWRERAAWAAATAHLNAAGYAVAVPPSLVGYLQQRGLIVWPCADRRAA